MSGIGGIERLDSDLKFLAILTFTFVIAIGSAAFFVYGLSSHLAFNTPVTAAPAVILK